jgi:hypothetical protein
MLLPRQLEADGTAEIIRQALLTRTARLWTGGDLYVPLIPASEGLQKVLRTGRFNNHIRYGLEATSAKLESEKKGIANVRQRHGVDGVLYGDRISRLLLISNDGAERFYRHIEHILRLHAPRVLGCLLDIDSNGLGTMATCKERRIKLVMVEHKDLVSDVLRAIAADYSANDLSIA